MSQPLHVSQPLRVLIAEDEALILMQLEFLVEDAGHLVVATAVTSEEAIALAHETRPDLVFVDLHLRNGSSGADIVAALRGDPAMVLVFVTANAQHVAQSGGKDFGAQDFGAQDFGAQDFGAQDFGGAAGVIAKPFTETVIFDTISYLEECVRRPPPRLSVPLGLQLAPGYRAAIAGDAV